MQAHEVQKDEKMDHLAQPMIEPIQARQRWPAPKFATEATQCLMMAGSKRGS